MMRFHRKTLAALGIIITMAWIGGCANNQQREPSSFDKWRELAKKSRGYSPEARQKTIDLPAKKIETIAPTQKDTRPSRPLPTRKITMTMHQTDTAVLLRALARAVNLNIMINEGIKGKISINVKMAQWDQVFKGILNSQGLAYEWEGDIVRIVTSEDRDRSLKNLEAEEKILAKKRELQLQAPLVTKIIPIDFASAEKLKTSVEKMLSSNKPGESVGFVVVDSHTNSLIVQAAPSDIEKLVPLITELDRPTPQILIEAHIIETTSRTARELGVQWGGLYYNSGQNYWIVPGATGAISGVQPGSGEFVNPGAGTAANFPANLGNAQQTGTGFNLGIITELGDRILSFQLSALEEEGKLNILSSPSITTLDNVKATIESGSEIPVPVVEDDDVEIIYKPAVLSLEVTPHVIQDNALKLEISTTKDEVGSVFGSLGYPVIFTKKAATNIILFDGQTTVIGGLKKTTSQDNDAGVPWLWKIPGLGHLFKSQSKQEQMEEILIFITPHILKTRPAQLDQPVEDQKTIN